VRATWTGADANSQLTLRLSWSLPAAPNGSFFQRVNGSDGDHAAMEGYTYPISGKAGSKNITLDVRSSFRTCEGTQRLYMALFDPAGENGGYVDDANYWPPALLYNCKSNCVSGGHAPPAGTPGLCPDATWDELDVPAAVALAEIYGLATGPATRALPGAGFTFGVNGSNSCPVNSVRIETEEQCRSAAAAVAKKYAGNETLSSYPKGCYLYGRSLVYFNMVVNGAGRSGTQLLCSTVPIDADWIAALPANLPLLPGDRIVVEGRFDGAFSVMLYGLPITIAPGLSRRNISFRITASLANGLITRDDAYVTPPCNVSQTQRADTPTPTANPTSTNAPNSADPSGEYLYGDVGRNECPERSQRIVTEAACRRAANATGRVFATINGTGYPRGCYAKPTSTDRLIYLNTNNEGAGSSIRQLVCARSATPPPTATPFVKASAPSTTDSATARTDAPTAPPCVTRDYIWGPAQTSGDQPLKQGLKFSIALQRSSTGFEVTVDGLRMPEFDFKLRIESEVVQVGLQSPNLQDFRVYATPKVSLAPTFAPTVAPTYRPTASPTLLPTSHPTLAPTFESTEPGLVAWVKGLVGSETASPTIVPTLKPTSSPSRRPTFNPTFKPTSVPTVRTRSPTATSPPRPRPVLPANGLDPVIKTDDEPDDDASVYRADTTQEATSSCKLACIYLSDSDCSWCHQRACQSVSNGVYSVPLFCQVPTYCKCKTRVTTSG